MLDFLSQYGDLIHLGLYFIVAIILVLKTGNSKYLKEVYEELKYRTSGSAEATKKSAQRFTSLKPIYRLNKATNDLELTDETIDITEIANSCKDYCMQAVLERFFPTEQPNDVVQEQVDLMQDDLDIMRSTFDLAESYRSKFGLSNDMSVNDIFEYVGKKSIELKEKLKEQENAQEIIEVGKQTELSQNGNESC